MKKLFLDLICIALLTSLRAHAGPQYPFPVSKGGTGAKTLTSTGILMGNGTSAISAASGLTHSSGGTGGLLVSGAGGTGFIEFLTSNSAQFDGPTSNHYALLYSGTGAIGSNDFLIYTHGADPIDFYTNSGFVGAWLSGGGLQIGSSGPILSKYTGNTLYIGLSGGSTLPAMVSAAPATNGLQIVRGIGANNGSGAGNACTILFATEGFSCVNAATGGQITVTYSTGGTAAFQDTAVCTCSVSTGTCTAGSEGASSVVLTASNGNNTNINFICIGQRNSSN